MAHVTFLHTAANTTQTSYLKIYPNPASDIIHIEARKIQGFHIIENMELINSEGKRVDQWKNCPTKFYFDTRKYPDGIYFLKIKTNIQSETVQVVISKH